MMRFFPNANWRPKVSRTLIPMLKVFCLSMMLMSCKEEVIFVKGADPVDTVAVGVTAAQVMAEMGPGFNLGNTFENGNNATTLASVKPLIDGYHNAGMQHVRIPVTWMDRFTATNHLADDNGVLNTENTRFKELVKVIDYALSLNMYVVINTHHEHWLKDNYTGSQELKTKFSNLWTGIATYFKDYDHHLVFEVLNEPEGQLGEWGSGWPEPTSATALQRTREINKIGFDAIRAAGGKNDTRVVMISTNAQGNEAMIEEVYPTKASLPGLGKDKYLAIQVHSYNPWAFCGQTGSNTAYPGDASIAAAIRKVGTHSRLINVPVNYGEFGVGRQTNTAERNTDLVRGYYKTFAKTTLSEAMSYSVWDDRGWFGLVNSTGTSFTFQIVPTMLAP